MQFLFEVALAEPQIGPADSLLKLLAEGKDAVESVVTALASELG